MSLLWFCGDLVRRSTFTEGATKWARGLRAIEAIGFDDRWDAEAKKKLGGG